MAIICLLGLLTVLSYSLYKTYSNLRNQDTFYITEIDDETYVYIYQNDDSIILEKATIDGRCIYIDTSSQVLQEKTSISLNKQSFDKVIKE